MVAAENQTNDEQLLQMAIETAKRGNKDAARNMMREVWNRNKRNERALIWLAKLSRNQKERKQWLERILMVNPNNAAAQNALNHMNVKRSSQDNRTLVLFGGVAAVMIILVVIILVIALSA